MDTAKKFANPLVETLQLSQSDFDVFAKLSGDDNPIHTDPIYAATTHFGATVSHGMLLFSRLRAVLNGHFPGATLLEQSLTFTHPAYADQRLKLHLHIEAEEGGVMILHVDILRPDGLSCLSGVCHLQSNEGKETPV
ncbi:MAG: hydratase [Marinospirillum sp.]|uniref:MaoC family dehydratase n=1 Tax=Marinospirillum sp. TaxID=2183934 RepID=UPI001A0F8972|nr:MaoC/PaaZ C-terminal domain-containing protein [Marinospirillum sp.]MBE0506649.1 hydratase [Marinospirillum sp.]